MALDKKQRQWAKPVDGVPAFYRNRNWPYKGRRTLVKTYPTFPVSHQEPLEFVPMPQERPTLQVMHETLPKETQAIEQASPS